MHSSKVLVVATSGKTEGGITSVIKAHSECDFWKKHHIKWIETHINKNVFFKIGYAFKAFVTFLFIAPFYDIIHIHLSEAPSAIRKTLFFIVGKLYRKKIILHFHSFSPATTINGKFKFLYQTLFKHADRVVVLSELWKKWIKDSYQLDENIRVIYNPCPSVSCAAKNTPKQPVVIYAGAICERKGYHDLLKGFSLIAKKHPEWKLLFAGSGEIEKGLNIAKQLDIASQVEFAGWVRGEAKENLFLSASIFCLPSYAEGFPMAVLDACSYGLPLITTPVGGIPDIIKNEANGLLFTPGDTNQLASQLEKLISDKQLRETLGKQSKLLADKVFNLEIIGRQIDLLYEDLY